METNTNLHKSALKAKIVWSLVLKGENVEPRFINNNYDGKIHSFTK